MTAARQDTQLVAAHNKGFVSAATINKRNTLSGAVQGATMKAVGQDAQLVVAHNKGFVSAATINKWNTLAGAARGAAMKAVGRDSHLIRGKNPMLQVSPRHHRLLHRS